MNHDIPRSSPCSRVPDEVWELVDKLLRSGLGPSEIRQVMRNRGITISVLSIGRRADKIGVAVQSGRRKGSKMPGVGGRPRGSVRSPHRRRAQELRQQGHSLRVIAALLGQESGRTFTAEGIRKLLLFDGNHKN